MRKFPTYRQSSRLDEASDASKGLKKNKKFITRKNHVEKDQTASTECPTTMISKTTTFFNERKSSLNTLNHDKTALNSLLHRDSVSKEGDSQTIRLTSSHPKQAKALSKSPRHMNPKSKGKREKGLDWDRILDSKDKEIKDLEEITVTIHKEINEAVNYLEEKKLIPFLFEEKEKQVEILHDKLGLLLQGVDCWNDKSTSHQDTVRVNKTAEKLEDLQSESQRSHRGKNVIGGDTKQRNIVFHIRNQETLNNLGSREKIQMRETVKNYNVPMNVGYKSYRNRRGSAQDTNLLAKLMRRLQRSLSPEKVSNIQNGNEDKFKMYSEDPVKKLVSNYLKRKPMTPNNKDLNFEISKIDSNKRDKKSTGIDPIHEEGVISNRKSQGREREVVSSSPVKKNVLFTNVKLVKKIGQPEVVPRESARAIVQKQGLKQFSTANSGANTLKRKNEDVVRNVENVLEEFYLLAEKYKALAGNLRKKNKALEKKIINLSENKSLAS